MPFRSMTSWPWVKSVISPGDHGALEKTKWSLPPAPVMVSEPWPALRVSLPAPPTMVLPGKLVVELITTPGVPAGGGGEVGGGGDVGGGGGEVALPPKRSLAWIEVGATWSTV